MGKERFLFALLSTLVILVGLAACSTEPEETGPGYDEAEWTALQEVKASLDGQRATLATLRAGEVPEGEVAEGEEPPAEADIAARAESLGQELVNSTDEYISRLVTFINSLIDADLEESEIFKQAVGMKTDEDILVAQEYIDRGGEYAKAINIYQQAMGLDPDNEKLKAAIDLANELRFMSEERFGQVKKGMTQDEVKELLGALKQSNMRDFPERKVVGWFYRKDDGGAAAVYFRQRGGTWKVYDLNYNAIKQQVEGE